MELYDSNIEKLRRLSRSYFILYITAKAIGGLGIGVLLANWLPTWTWWIFIVVAVLIAVPVIIKVSR